MYIIYEIYFLQTSKFYNQYFTEDKKEDDRLINSCGTSRISDIDRKTATLSILCFYRGHVNYYVMNKNI